MASNSGRISWDKYFMNICKDISLRSTCKRAQYGAVVVRNNILVSTGYNGAPRGFPHCLDIGCLKDELNIPHGEGYEICRSCHAEQNALLQAGRNSEDATIYMNGYPCKICAKLIINAGIKRVVIAGEPINRDGIDLLKEAKMEVIQL